MSLGVETKFFYTPPCPQNPKMMCRMQEASSPACELQGSPSSCVVVTQFPAKWQGWCVGTLVSVCGQCVHEWGESGGKVSGPTLWSISGSIQ